MDPRLNPKERNAILAGLRLLQQKLRMLVRNNRYEVVGTAEEEAVNDILTNGWTESALGPVQIDELCERINSADEIAIKD
jgi:hypothetical protein